MSETLTKELLKDYEGAVKQYEYDISNSTPCLTQDSFINLSFLYWSFAFEYFEFIIPNKTSDELSILGGDRYMKILDLGSDRFPFSLELRFWKRYFQHISFGEEFSVADCLNLLNLYPNDKSKVPFFFLYGFDKSKYMKERDELVRICLNEKTAKNIYILSIIG